MFIIYLQFGHTLFTTDHYNTLKDKGKGFRIYLVTIKQALTSKGDKYYEKTENDNKDN